ncbi:MAG: tetratricopeptide repeat protein [Bacteriovoracales bacterium]|nr:tetratricopeptide repeat protein [Bacteriovoracales bacterium]
MKRKKENTKTNSIPITFHSLAQLVTKYKALTISLAVLLVLGAAAPALWTWYGNEKRQDFAQKTFSFRKRPLEDFKKGELKVETFLEQAQEIAKRFKGNALLGPFLLDVAHELLQKEHFQETADLLSEYAQGLGGSPYLKTLLGFQLASAYEDLGRYDRALSTLKALLPLKLSEDKIYFDLGRYHQLKGDTIKAKQSFDYVMEKHPDSEFAKLAKVYAHERPRP